jgi:hypothetical protein
MPDSTDNQIRSENNTTALAPSAQGAVPLDSSAAPALARDTVASSTKLTSIRGIPARDSKALALVLDDPSLQSNPAFAEAYVELSSIYREELKQLWLVARLDPALDRGGELSKLLTQFCQDPSLKAHPELISQLYSIATAESLFGLTRDQYQQRGIDFNKIRREFLVDIIRGAISSDNITQGKEPLCTVGVASKLLSKAEFLRLVTSYALDGRVTTASGAEMHVWPQFIDRAYAASEAALGDVKCARRSAGMLTVLYGMTQLGDSAENPSRPLVERQQGLYWHQYTLAVEKLLGEQVACAHRTAHGITIDSETGYALPEGSTASTKQVDVFGYLEEQLARGRTVFIDTRFNFSSNNVSSGSQHCRHALAAERIEMRDGQRWFRCSNPIGDFVDTSKSGHNHAEFFPAGTILGDRRGFWFETAENGDILVRADVLQRNLQTVLVQYGTPFVHEPGVRPQFIGDPAASHTGPIFFYDFTEDIAPMQSEPMAVAIHEALGKLFTEQQAPTMRDSQDGPQVEVGSGRREVVKRKTLEEDLLAAQATQLLQDYERREDKRESEAETGAAPGAVLGVSWSAVVGHAFEYGRDGGRDVSKPQAQHDMPQATPAATSVVTATDSAVKKPVVAEGTTTTIGLKTLFG